ncbi:iron chaperone [Demequina sp.]|uniref:iron chaperone n=1 Tax=Demequina sp. TaxID=2050685 RepID=UPI0025F07FE9|nr:DUF1801 domain-containing protein [Demequina sp.]
MANNDGFTAEERAAMKETAAERRAAAKRGKGEEKAAADLADVLAKIAAMDDADRALAERVHAIVTEVAPGLAPKTWYGMPAYARDGKVVCFFKDAGKFTSRYATLGFEEAAQLDEGTMWVTSFAITEIGDAEEAQIRELVRRAAG